MKKISYLATLLSLLSLGIAVGGCNKTPSNATLPPASALSSQHVPTPLPVFPDREPPSRSDDRATPTDPDPALWDVSDVDVSKIDPARSLIAFTFDDTPARYLENILAIYADFNERNPDCVASATLFVNGCRYDAQTPSLLTAALALGFELGNHTYSHTDLTTLSLAETTAEIDRVDGQLFPFDHKPRHLFRPPYGKLSPSQKSAVTTPIVSWTIDTLDWTGIDEESVYRSVMENKFPGAIVLMHDGAENTVRALKRLLPDLKAQGYQVVGVSQMSKVHACPLYAGKEYIRARKR